ncbi:MFS transporter [Aeromicrobium sp. Root495]|uniref:MFS transporter n=1 Tax=Aeromicrobium sp. Root495 TaxID=1736550 RepID=UPI00138F6B6E|nr:MFS transporter [Aeromicrobium sp. Root495]
MKHTVRTGIAVAAMITGAAVVLGSVAGLIAIVPETGRDLGASQSQVQLVIDVTAVALGALVLPFGAMLDRYGRRRGALWGFSGLALALLASSVADTVPEMLLARTATGIFAAIGFPATLATLTSIVSEDKRPRAVAAWSAATMAGGTAALLIAGAAAEVGHWRAFFVVMAGLSVLVALGTLIAVPETRDPEGSHVDVVGSLLSIVGIGAVIVAIIEMPVHGITSARVAGTLTVGVLFMTLFVTWCLRASQPLIDLRLLRNRRFSAAVFSVLLLYLCAYGWFFLSFQYGSYVLGYGPLAAAGLLLTNAVATVPASFFGPAAVRRWGFRAAMTAALLAAAAGLAIMAATGSARDPVLLAIGFCAFGLGLGLGMTPATEEIISSLPGSRQGAASAINDVVRELGAASGIAVFGAIFNAYYRSSIDGAGLAPTVVGPVRDSPAIGTAVAADRPGVLAAIETAVVSGWNATFVVGTAVLLVAAVWVCARSGSAAASPSATAPTSWEDTPGPRRSTAM